MQILSVVIGLKDEQPYKELFTDYEKAKVESDKLNVTLGIIVHRSIYSVRETMEQVVDHITKEIQISDTAFYIDCGDMSLEVIPELLQLSNSYPNDDCKHSFDLNLSFNKQLDRELHKDV